MNKPRVINLDLEPAPPDAVFIGRPSKFGNPFKVGPDGTLEDVIIKYIDWMKSQPELMEAAKRELIGRDLCCFCKPLICHGDLLLQIANNESFDINDDNALSRLIKEITNR